MGEKIELIDEEGQMAMRLSGFLFPNNWQLYFHPHFFAN
jgi:hypothetical protein